MLRQIADGTSKGAIRPVDDVTPIIADCSSAWRLLAGEKPKQGGFSGAVLADDAGHALPADIEGQGIQECGACDRELEVVEGHSGRRFVRINPAPFYSVIASAPARHNSAATSPVGNSSGKLTVRASQSAPIMIAAPVPIAA